MNDAATPRRIWLCADDYGLAEWRQPRHSRNSSDRGRLNADLGDGGGLRHRPRRGQSLGRKVAAKSPRCAIGLHATLTAPFRPLTMHFRPTDGGMFLPFAKLLRAGLLRRLDVEMIYGELMVQLRAFQDLFGRAPDFVDEPSACAVVSASARKRFCARVKEAAPGAWVRQGGRIQPLRNGWPRRSAGARRPEFAIPQAGGACRAAVQPGLWPAPMIFSTAAQISAR